MRRARRRGMTLIELIIALTIGSMVIAAVLAVLTSATRTQDLGERRADLLQSVRVSLNQMQRDLQFAVMLSTDTEGQFAFVGTDSGSDGLPQDVVEFTSASGDPLSSLLPTGDLQRVQLYIDEDDSTEQTGLVRSSLRLPLPEEISPTEAELSARTYCPWAVGLNCEYYDATATDWVEEWEDRTDLPGAVRIVLYALPEPPEGDAEPQLRDVMPFSTVVYLAMGANDLGAGQPEAEQSTEAGTTTTPTALSGAGLGAPAGSLPTAWDGRTAGLAGRADRTDRL